jgi:hypothetical protein
MVENRIKCFAIVMASVVGMVIGWLPAVAESPSDREYLVKAAFLYNFAKFVEWPPEVFVGTQAPMILCIVGADPFGRVIQSIEGKTVKGRRLVIQRAAEGKRLEPCHILFVSASENKRLPDLLSKLDRSPVLTVSDMRQFSHLGGMITLIKAQDTIRFEINVDAAQHVNLKISSELLRLAKIVTSSRIKEKP